MRKRASRAIRIELKDVGSIFFSRVGVGIVDIGIRTDRDKHLLAIERKTEYRASSDIRHPAGR